MKFPEKYIKRGKFKLHSGCITNIFYDVNAMLTDTKLIWDILEELPDCKIYVGIATGGAIIASQAENWAMIKDGELKGEVKGKYCLIDDVCTTETSLREAIKILQEKVGKYPEEIFVVVDRRREFMKIRKLHIESMYEV